MNKLPFRLPRRGSALITIVFLSALMAILTASLLTYSGSERRSNERQRLILRARNMAENISVYAAEQLTVKLMRLRSVAERKFTSGVNQIYLPPDSVLTTAFSQPTDMQVWAGMTKSTALEYVEDLTNPNAGLYVSTSTIPIAAKATMTQPNVGSFTAYCEHTMEIAMIPLFQFGIFYNMDLELFPGQDMTISGPVHTNGELIARGEAPGSATLTFEKRVTAAAGLFANGQKKVKYRSRVGDSPSDPGGTGAVNFSNPKKVKTNLKSGSTWRDHNWGGKESTPTTLSQFKTFATNTYGGYLRTNVHGVTPLELPAIGTYKQENDPDTPEDDRNNGRQIIEAPNAMRYIDGAWTSVSDSAADREAKLSRKAGLYIVVNPDDERRFGRLPDGSSIPMIPHTYRCFLNSIGSDGTQTIREVVLPGQPGYGYNAGPDGIFSDDDFMYPNDLPNRFTNKTIVGWNQVLRIAGSSRTGATLKDWEKARGTDVVTPAKMGNETLSFPDNRTVTPFYTPFADPGTDTTPDLALDKFGDAYFFDLRRATNSRGYPYQRSSYPYTPRPIAKIDFDMARFKMSVERTMAASPRLIFTAETKTYGYNPGFPGIDAGVKWSNSIFKSDGTPADLPHGLDAATSYKTFPTSSTKAAPDPFRMYFAPDNPKAEPALSNLSDNPSVYGVGGLDLYNDSTGPWYDGITVYIHSVDAERRNDHRIDSGVRLLNGRGPAISFAKATGNDGLTFVTNDALYVIGHFNADGAVNASTSNETAIGGYSARFKDNENEMLTALMADAITILSQPTFAVSGSGTSAKYYQVGGWNDALSAHAADNGNELSRSANWRTTNPSSSNEVEGEGFQKRAGGMPYNSVSSAMSMYAQKPEKLPTVTTEVSAALLTGIVPSDHDATGLTDGPPKEGKNAQYSGGAHNFPRLLEDWHEQLNNSSSSSTLCIRGSMVALFESRVAMEPFNLRCYLAPVRVWGLHKDFEDKTHHLPLEPVVISSRRMRYKELTPVQYATIKTQIEALPE